MIARSGKNLNNISTVALQLYGPHMDYAANLFTQNGRIGNVKFKWLKNLTVSDRVGGKAVDPITAFQIDNSLDAVMCIIPDGLMLTSGDKIGTGTDNSVKGCKKILSTKTANKIIYDVYAFRKDYFDANKEDVEKFVKGMFLAEEKLKEVRNNPKDARYVSMISKGATFFGLANNEVSDMLGDCRFLGYNGNVSFFTGVNTTRNFKTLNKEISTGLKTLGILKTTPKILSADWNYASMTSGLAFANKAVEEKKFNQEKVTKMIETKIASESETWEEEGTLFKVEIYFEPNQEDFSSTQYAKDFEKALTKAQTFGGALIIIEGHSDPGGVLKAKKSGEKQPVIQQMEQTAKNLSQKRADNVKKSYISYCKGKNIKIDESQLNATGLGIKSPKYVKPTTKEEWQENFRVVFVVKQVEGESEIFDPSVY